MKKILIGASLLLFTSLVSAQSTSDCMGVGMPAAQATLVCSNTKTVTGNFEVDATGDILLDAGGGDINFATDAATWMAFNEEDIIFAGAGTISTTGQLLLNSSTTVVSAVNGVTQTSLLAGSLNYHAPDYAIRSNTIDGSDSYQVSICGGGSNATGRGAFGIFYGNEDVGAPGDLILTSGDAADGDVVITAMDDFEVDAGDYAIIDGGTVVQLKVAGATIAQALSSGLVISATKGLVPAFATADPCGVMAEGAIFYNDTSNYMCYCNGSNDVKMSDDTTACF